MAVVSVKPIGASYGSAVPVALLSDVQCGAFRDRPAVIANLSARVGSISDNELGGWYSYRCPLLL